MGIQVCSPVSLGRYTLIITEKPDAAKRIAAALDNDGNAKKLIDNGVPFYQANRNGEIIVVPALGHLYTIDSKERNSRDCPVFDYQWVPRYLVERGASRIRVWLKVIAKLAKNAEVFIDACDFDIEGSIIGYCILKYACGSKEETAKRMKYSTLTREELQESYDQVLPHLDFPLINAGLARHEIDWLYGINLSRALTTAVKSNSGQYATISTGRVQGPTLKFLEHREKTIKCFVPTPYWNIVAKIAINNTIIAVEYEKILESKPEATLVLDSCKTKEANVEKVEVKEFKLSPPFPFDLGALQNEAYRIFHYTPIRTLNIAQHLYLDALISYPRTSSQKLPPAIGYMDILRKISKASLYSKHIRKLLSKPTLEPNEGEKSDPAHPAIYPTGNLPGKPIGIPERNIFDLVVRRFIAVFGEPAIRQTVTLVVSINGNHFQLTAIRTLSDGWLEFYKPYVELKDVTLPALTKGQKVAVKRVVLKDNFTKPPPRHNPRSLLMKMEKEEIGTKATRAGIIQTLCDRKYLNGTSSLVVSDLGFEVIEILERFCPTVVSSELTRELEQEMNQIQLGAQTKQTVLQNAIKILKPVISELKAKQSAIGSQLSDALKKSRIDEKTIGACTKCADGKLVILRSKKTGKRFVGCTNYFEKKCNLTFPLPQNGTVKPLYSACKICGSPTIYLLTRLKKPLKLCINPNCLSKGVRKG
ncbi:MAG: DNA topoisomerase I [Candidatus Bathyarchaeia archaeon]